jgi:hypothetical protein
MPVNIRTAISHRAEELAAVAFGSLVDDQIQIVTGSVASRVKQKEGSAFTLGEGFD